MAVRTALGWCNNCRENSVHTKTHIDKGYTLSYCINKGCGYKSTIPYPLIVPYLICGMNYEEAERYCEYVTPQCDGEKGYCAKDEVQSA